MKKHLLLSLLIIFTVNLSFAQILTASVPTGGTNTYSNTSYCYTLYDAGITGNYGNNWDGYAVLNPTSAGATVSISGTYDVETNYDYIYIYRGVGAATLIATLNGSGSYSYTGAPGESVTVRFDTDGSVTRSGFQFNVRYNGYDIGEETGNETTADCITRSFGFGSGAAETFSVQPNTRYFFSWANGTNAAGFRGDPNVGATFTTNQTAWNSGGATSVRFSSNRSNSCTWSSSSSTLTYRVVTPGATTVSGGGTFCGSRTISASGGANGTIYFQGTTNNGTSTANATTSATVTSSGRYYFRAMNGGCWGAQGFVDVVIQSTANNPGAISVPANICVGDAASITNVTAATTGTPASAGPTYYYYWRRTSAPSTGYTNYETTTSLTSALPAAVTGTPGTYLVARNSAFACTGQANNGTTVNIPITVNANPAATTVSGGGTQCGGSRTITASGGAGGTIYFQGTTSNGTSTGTASSSQSVSSSGTYYFRSRSAAGCWGPQGSVSVTINSVPAATTVSGGGTQCGGSRTITASGGAGGTIYFQGTTSNGTSTGTPSTSQSVSSSGTYYFRSRSAAGCWGPQGSVSVTINPIPAATTVSGGGTQCGGSRTITASGGAGGTIYFQGTTSNGTSTGTPSTSQSVSSSGTYYFRSRSAAGCWGPQGSVSVTINPIPAATTVSGGGTQCGGSRTITASGGAGGTIYFQGTTSNGTSTGTPSTSQSVSSSGTYYFRSRSAAGCWGPQGSVSVTINPLPAATTVSGGGTFCGSTTITAGGGTGGTIYFQGTTNNGTSTATASTSQSVSSSGTYYFRSRSAAGCWGPQGSVSVTIDAAPTVSNAGPNQFACLTPAATMAANNPAVGTGAWTWTGPGTVSYQGGTSASDRDAQVLFSTSGTYTGTWTISNGVCTPSANTVDIEVNNPSTVVFADATGVCESVSVNDWVHLYNASGNIIASVRDNGQNIGDVTASVYYHGGNSFSVPANNGQCPGNWQAVLNRSFVINSTIAPSNDVDVRLYFTDAELASLIAQAGCGDPNGCADDDDVCGIGGLYVTQISGASSEDGTFVNGDGTFTLHTPSNGGTGNATFGANYVEVSVNGFSEFWIHGSESGVVLPVELLSFTVEAKDNTYIQLDWSTATEINNEGFEVLRSTDGVNFEPIAFVNGNGNTNTVHNYNHKDGAVVKGQTYYYQLKQIDFDGGYEYFDIKSARLDKDNEGIEISGFIPNPAEDKSVIRFSVTKEVRAMVSLYDITGKLVLTQEANLGDGENTISLNTTELAAGTYNAKIIVGSDVYSRRLMINK